MTDELELLLAVFRVACVVLVIWGAVLCLGNLDASSAGLHMFDESGPLQSRRVEDVPDSTALEPAADTPLPATPQESPRS
jgi:hypothetical protein